jgi:hypothetical protein
MYDGDIRDCLKELIDMLDTIRSREGHMCKTLGDAMSEFEEAQEECDYVNLGWSIACVLAGTDAAAVEDFNDFCHYKIDHPVTPRDVIMWAILWESGTDWRD